MKQCECGSLAINHNLHGRDGSDPDLCDVCYWRKRASIAISELKSLSEAYVRLMAAHDADLISAYSVIGKLSPTCEVSE